MPSFKDLAKTAAGSAKDVATLGIGHQRESPEGETQQQQELARARVDHAQGEREEAFSDAQRACPFPVEFERKNLTGKLSLFHDEFLIKGQNADLKNGAILTTQRLILTHSKGRVVTLGMTKKVKDQEVIYLRDIQDVKYHKGRLRGNDIAIETSGGHSFEDIHVTGFLGWGAQQWRDNLLQLAHYARQRSQSTNTTYVTPAPTPPTPSSTDKYDHLARLADLKDKGILSTEEFEQEKAKLLDS